MVTLNPKLLTITICNIIKSTNTNKLLCRFNSIVIVIVSPDHKNRNQFLVFCLRVNDHL